MQVPLTIADHLRRAELVYGDRVAFVDEPDQVAPPLPDLTYRRVAELSRAMAAGLDGMGLDHGARVAMVSHNAARLLVFLFGTSAFGRVGVPINFRLNAEEVQYIVDHSGADVLIMDPELEADLGDVKVRTRLLAGEESDALFVEGVEPRPWTPDENATATINYTSGTTARPKGVEMTHRNLWLNAAVFGWQTGVNDRDVYLHTLPMFHCNGWGMPYAMTGMGGRHIVLRKVDGAEILRRIEQHGVTLLCGAPAVIAAVLDAAADWDGEIPGTGTMRIVVAGAPPPTRTIERVETELGWEFIQIYGLTETAPLLTMNRNRAEWDDDTPAERAARLSRAGAPALGVTLTTSPEGELLARTNHVLKSYWDQPEATSEALADDWFHTGDGATIDDENFATITDRKKDVIISGGENVSSIEVEDTLFSHPAVAEVAVIGVPDEKWGETIKALIVLTPDAEFLDEGAPDERALIDHCRERLAHFKCPTTVEFRDELARTATGKLQKFKLRAPYWEGMAKQVN
ncbi:MAG: AMP-dependent synthetase [Acidimicrobiaceae bacterium]|nr:AMP-dependent synthetase [Acidimicrobiaceae bacterium]